MKKSALLIALVLTGTAYAQAVALKPGLWEVKVVHQIVDGKDSSIQIANLQAKMQESLAKMTPEQRKQMEAMMSGLPLTPNSGMRICVSPAMVAKNISWIDRSGVCSSSMTTRSANATHFNVNCQHDGRSAVGVGTSTMNGNTISTHVDLKVSDSQGLHAVLSDTDMTFIAADCQGVVPMDQLANRMQHPDK